MEQFFVVTYDVCEHHQLFEQMNAYPVEAIMDLDEQVRKAAKKDIAPLVRVYEKDPDGTGNPKVYKEYHFVEYACNCNE